MIPLVKSPPSSFLRWAIPAPDYLKKLSQSLDIPVAFDRMEIHPIGEFPFPPAWGEVSTEAGKTALRSLEEAVAYCRSRPGSLLVTAPVCKESLTPAGFRHPGQTEFLGDRLGCSEKATMAFFSDRFHLLLITSHIPLRQVPGALTVEGIVSRGIRFRKALSSLGLTSPRIAVCGLNPHASESGMFGDEERTVVEPAVGRLNEYFGDQAFQGPFPPDTVFYRLCRMEFDAVVALYHDQGLIPLKMLAFDQAVNVTLGLPIIRTSPDHGTGFDIAGTGKADPSSMKAAIRWGLKMANSSLADPRRSA